MDRLKKLNEAKANHILIDNTAAGGCYPKSLSIDVFGDESHDQELRLQMVNIIRDHPSHFKKFMQDGMKLSTYLKNLSKNKTWFDEAGIAASAILLNRPVNVYCDSLKYPVPIVYNNPFDDANNEDPFLVYRQGEAHFMLMKPNPKDSDNGSVSELSDEDEDESDTLLPVSEGSATSDLDEESFKSASSDFDKESIVILDDASGGEETIEEDDELDNEGSSVEDDGDKDKLDDASGGEETIEEDDELDDEGSSVEDDGDKDKLDDASGDKEKKDPRHYAKVLLLRASNRNKNGDDLELNEQPTLLDSVKNVYDAAKSFMFGDGKIILFEKIISKILSSHIVFSLTT